jgi:hypothetical protein
MTQEEKELLLKDICARLPYGVVIHFDEKTDQDDERLYGMRENGGKFLINDAFSIEEIKPYLFPLSSMTEEHQREEYYICKEYIIGYESNLIDFYNKYHYDYRGLIPKGLAIDATNKNVY